MLGRLESVEVRVISMRVRDGAPRLDPYAAAEAAVRAYCGWHVAPVVEETITLDGSGTSTLALPSMHVLDVSRVLVRGDEITDRVRWSQAGMLEGPVFPRRFRWVTVTFRHGFEPEEVGEVLGVIERAGARFATDPTIARQSVGGASVEYRGTRGGGAPSHLLMDDERAALDRYRLVRGP